MWRALIAAGIVWVLATALLGVVLIQRTLDAAGDGTIAQPHSAQIVVAVVSIVIFGLPGVVLVLAGWRRRTSPPHSEAGEGEQ